MPKPTYTFEVATNTPTGIWKIADRTFHDRRLSMREKRMAFSGAGDIPVLAAALSILKVEGEDITEEWLEDNLTADPNPVVSDIAVTFAYILGGAPGVAKLLADHGG